MEEIVPMNTLLRRVAVAVAAPILVAACASTKMVHSWSAPGFNKETVKKVLVLGISPNAALRRTFEDSFSVKLENLGYQAVSGYLWIPDATNLDRDAIIARIKAEHVTHVLVTRVLDTKEVVTYHPPTTVAVGYGGYGPGYYGSWSTYYTVGYGAVMDPGYTTVNDVVTLETNLYDASREKDALVYSGQSDTWTDQAQSGSKIDSVISAVVYTMRAKHVL
jgi:hypothetical protein